MTKSTAALRMSGFKMCDSVLFLFFVFLFLSRVEMSMQRVLTLDVPEDVGSKERHEENSNRKGVVSKDLALASCQERPAQK